MRRSVPSTEQTRAIVTPGNLLVRAGAGSGKTEVLARRFVTLVAGEIEGSGPLMPDQIVAITFTEKAAHDMKERIEEVMATRVADPYGADPAHLKRVLRTIPLARISTIHAFCARLLRENPIEAALDPAFQVLDEYESRTFVEARCAELLIDALRAGTPGAIHLLGARRLRGASPYREGALEIVARLVGELHRLGKSAKWLREAARDTARSLAAQSTSDKALALKQAMENLIAALPRPPKTSEKAAALQAEWPRYREMIERFGPGSDNPMALAALRELREALPDARGDLKEPIGAVDKLLANPTTRLGLSGDLIMAYGAERAARPTVDSAELLATIAEQLDAIKRREAVVTFDDLLVLAERLLKDHPAVRTRYRSAFRAILVDEYQDTNPIQDAIVRVLTEPDGDTPTPQLFIVGDEKQSIYRFRGTDVTVFSRARRPEPTSLTLRENRRSNSSVLAFINALSAHVMRPKLAPSPPYWVTWSDRDHRLIPIREPLCEPSVEVVLTAGDDRGRKRSALAKREAEAAFLARRILELVSVGHPVFDTRSESRRPARYGDAAILLRSFNDVSIYENALRAANVPFHTVKGRGFFGCPEVLDLADLINVIDDPTDAIALAAVLRSPLFALSDNCLLEIAMHADEGGPSIGRLFAAEKPDFDWIQSGRDEAIAAWRILWQLRDTAKRGSIVEVIERALELTDFEAVMVAQADGRQRLANIRKLAELAMVFETHRMFGFKDFAAHLRSLVDEPPNEPQAQILGEGENVVRLMTIHQAKGLEFPIVIVADLGRGTPPGERNYLLSPERGLLLCDVIGSAREELPNPLIREYRETVADQEAAESARILYVAMTRARDLLILSEGSERGGWAKEVRAFIGTGRVHAFLESGSAEQALEAGGAKFLLRVADAPAIASEATPAATPVRALAPEDFSALASARLAFTPPGETELIVSPVELADFERCPRQYQFRHRLGLPERPIFGSDGDSAIEMGTLAHAVLERLDFDLPEAECDAEIAAMVASMAACSGLGAGARAATVRDLQRYARARDRDEKVVGRELPLFMSVTGSGLTLFIRGRIDILAASGARLVVRDYKYARGDEDDASSYRVQMECYALAAQSKYPERTVEAELIFIRDSVRRIPIPLDDPASIRDKLLTSARAMLAARQSGDYPKKPPGPDQCRRLGCGYVARCWRSERGRRT